MFRSILLFALLLCVNGEKEKFKPKKSEYCTKKCPPNLKSTGCDCKKQGTRSEVLEKIVEFRQTVVDEHNKLRNLLASGNETRGFAKSAANMLVVNYDMELEYLARCYGRSLFNGFRDKCMMLENWEIAVQNVGGSRPKDNSFDELIKKLIVQWYDEVKNMQSEMYSKFGQVGKYAVSSFTRMCWWSVNRIGCARIHTADTKKDKFTQPSFEQALICNYIAKDIGGLIRTEGEPVYTEGPPCSKCPEVTKYDKCNTKYTSLCGELEPVPTDKPYALSLLRNQLFKFSDVL
ncbi:scoloptoxin SSD558-like isoform X2 [Tribolium madens]|uniref:scoloptoxin SSD558-like isoform X2 n=1 Tax=Tribolium madens TaxID=41895 RepID=UPI001CF73D3E|nr:scoloptoxin SSD558-like isoform X2 [Tribolium madens]